jgi:hypothetical protein
MPRRIDYTMVSIDTKVFVPGAQTMSVVFRGDLFSLAAANAAPLVSIDTLVQ